MQKLRTFPTSPDLAHALDSIDPVKYGRTRNFLNGAVTRLSPYISRGVISTKKVMDHVLRDGYRPHVHEKFIQQLAWREYFQRVLQERPDLHEAPLKQDQGFLRKKEDGRVMGEGLPVAVWKAETGIEAVDEAIHALYETGWMHNHARMYVASIVTNIAGCRWQDGARWMYYHLLDADVASNGCSWQWVCSAFSSKMYFANQENINRYTGSTQKGGFLDRGYDAFPLHMMPGELQGTAMPSLDLQWPQADQLVIDASRPTLIYNFYNLDPEWHRDEEVNRVLLIEPSHFSRYPVSPRVMEFMLGLARNIPGMQVHVGEFSDLRVQYALGKVFYKEHPIFSYRGTEEHREWMFPEAKGYYPSFFSFWKRCQRYLR